VAGLPDYDLSGLATHQVFASDLCVAVPVGHRLAAAARVAVHELAGEPWVIGDGSAGDPQFRAWPTLSDPVITHRARSWPARLGLVAAGLCICLIPELAAPSVPAGVTTIGVDDPTWLGRVTLGQLLAAWVVHDLGHVKQVARVMAGQYREAVGPWRGELSPARCRAKALPRDVELKLSCPMSS
jgi:DNA-binding transcriptional LysR family regulator